MKKLWVIFGFIIIVLFYFLENRTFYCLTDNECITVWKTFNKTCIISPGKYYGLVKPNDNYIVTTNSNDITIFWNSKLNNSIILKCEQNYKIINSNKEKIVIHDFKNKNLDFLNILYLKNSKKFSDVKSEVDFISVNIKENYALDKNGNKL